MVLAECDPLRRAKLSLTCAVASLDLAACLLPGFWGRSGLLDGGTEVPGWAMVLGLPPLCCISWPSLVAMAISAKWLWGGRPRGAFPLACLKILPGASWLFASELGRMAGWSYGSVIIFGW